MQDKLLQGLIGLLFVVHAARESMPDQPSKAADLLDGVLKRGDQTVQEGRLAVQRQGQAVNGFGDDDDIVDAIAALGHEFLESKGTPRLKYTVIQEGAPRALRPMLRDEVYGIVRTAVRDAADFAHPSVIEVELDFSFGDFRVCVRDNGIGVEHRGEGNRQELDDVRRRLQPLKERADEFGGNFKVWSRQRAGTEIELTFSSQSAYTPRAVGPKPWFQHMIGKSWKT